MKKKYSVLLLYPEYINDDRNETYYAFVEAANPSVAVEEAQMQAERANKTDGYGVAGESFLPLLVLRGHIEAERYGVEL